MIINAKYTKNNKNNGVAPIPKDERIRYVPSGCGKCIECRKKYARDWQIRLLEEIKTNKNGKFITLTFSDQSIAEIIEMEIKKKVGTLNDIPNGFPVYKTYKIKELKGYEKDNAIATKAVHLFRKRWEKQFKKAPRHWLITELGHGGTENIHLHGIIWTNETYATIRKIWKYGYIWPRPETTVQTYVSSRTINYMVKYISKVDQRNKEYKSKVLSSPGMGAKYIETPNAIQNKFKGEKTLGQYTTDTGHKIALPTYYRNKLYTEEEKEELWINKLNKQERYVLGNKIDISKGEKEYKKAINYARELNKELGYGQRANENRKEYEEQRREIAIITRVKKASGGV